MFVGERRTAMSAGESAQRIPKQATASGAAESTLFLRKATGLVRSWSVFDAFICAQGAALWFAWDPTVYFIVCFLTVVFVTTVIALGMKTYARVQKFCFWVGNAGLLIVCLFLLFGSNEAFKAGLEANATNLFG